MSGAPSGPPTLLAQKRNQRGTAASARDASPGGAPGRQGRNDRGSGRDVPHVSSGEWRSPLGRVTGAGRWGGATCAAKSREPLCTPVLPLAACLASRIPPSASIPPPAEQTRADPPCLWRSPRRAAAAACPGLPRGSWRRLSGGRHGTGGTTESCVQRKGDRSLPHSSALFCAVHGHPGLQSVWPLAGRPPPRSCRNRGRAPLNTSPASRCAPMFGAPPPYPCTYVLVKPNSRLEARRRLTGNV